MTAVYVCSDIPFLGTHYKCSCKKPVTAHTEWLLSVHRWILHHTAYYKVQSSLVGKNHRINKYRKSDTRDGEMSSSICDVYTGSWQCRKCISGTPLVTYNSTLISRNPHLRRPTDSQPPKQTHRDSPTAICNQRESPRHFSTMMSSQRKSYSCSNIANTVNIAHI